MAVLRRVKWEQFVRQYIKMGGNATKAYEKVYPNCKHISAKAAACRLMRYPHIRKRYHEVLDIMVKRTEITIEKILNDYQLALEMAKDQGKPSDVVSAATAQAKLMGLLRERVETGQVGDFAEMENVSDILKAVSDMVGAEAAKGLIKAFDLETPMPAPEPPKADLAKIDPASDAVN